MKRDKRLRRDKFRKGIYILPNLFTSLNLFFGFYAIISSINHKFSTAATAIILAAVFDMLDGKIARATNTTSKFGIEYDSLADLISFGLAPGLMMYIWVLSPMGRIGWLAAFLFLACGALRLARFNTQVGAINTDYFLGLPIPAAACMSATTVLICYRLGIEKTINPVFVLILIYSLSFLMVSTLKYHSFKKPELFNRMNFNVLVAIILIIIFVAAQPSITLFLIGVLYIVSGPINSFRRFRKVKNLKTETHSVEEQESQPIS